MSGSILRAAVSLALVACGDNATVRLEEIRYQLADGTIVVDPDRIYDRLRDEDCTITRFASGERHCMPVTAGGMTVYDEETCQRALGAPPASEPRPRYLVRTFALLGREALPSRLYRPGEPTAMPTFVWRQEGPECLGPFPADDTLTYYTLGEDISADELATIRTSDTERSVRLSVDIDADRDGDWRRPGAVYDRLLDEPCTLVPSPNADTAPCVPDALPMVDYFGDAACTQPLVREPETVSHDLVSGCWSLLAPGAEHSGTVYEQIGETCLAVATPSMALYAGDAIHDIAVLARARTPGSRIEPVALVGLDDLPIRDGFMFDTALGADCRVEDTGAGLACVPASAVPVRPFFSDADCVVPLEVAFVPTGSCQPPARFAGDRSIGGVYPGVIYELTTGDRCAAYAPPARFTVHTVGEPVTDVVSATRLD